MAIVYGKPARSGISQLVQSCLSQGKISTPTDVEQPRVSLISGDIGNIFIRMSISLITAVSTMGISAFLVALLFPQYQLVGPIIVFITIWLLLRKTKTDYWSAIRGSTQTSSSDTTKTAKRVVEMEMSKLVEGGNVDDSFFDVKDRPLVFGCMGEIRTARTLSTTLDDSHDIINDIEIFKNGRVTANIDHLVLGPQGMFMVDSKVWSQPPEVKKIGKHSYIPHKKMHWDSVSTCLYEASFLPDAPRAIIFAVSGKGSHSLQGTPLTIDGYVPRFGDHVVKQLSVPVVFASQRDIYKVITDLETTSNARDRITVEEIRGMKQLKF